MYLRSQNSGHVNKHELHHFVVLVMLAFWVQGPLLKETRAQLLTTSHRWKLFGSLGKRLALKWSYSWTKAGCYCSESCLSLDPGNFCCSGGSRKSCHPLWVQPWSCAWTRDSSYFFEFSLVQTWKDVDLLEDIPWSNGLEEGVLWQICWILWSFLTFCPCFKMLFFFAWNSWSMKIGIAFWLDD